VRLASLRRASIHSFDAYPVKLSQYFTSTRYFEIVLKISRREDPHRQQETLRVCRDR
jgi:hypothetical protein